MSRQAWCARVYGWVWTGTAGTVIALGLVASVHVWGAMPTIATFLSAATLGGVCHLSVASLATPETVAWRHIGLGAVIAGVLTLAVGGLVEMTGGGAFWLAVLLGLAWPGWPAVVRRVRRPTRDRPKAAASTPHKPEVAPEPVPVPVDVSLVVPDRLDDADLGLAWRSSYVALLRTTTPESRLRVVLVRALYLDEMERTNPAAFADWLSTGPRAATSPRVLLPADDDHPAAT